VRPGATATHYDDTAALLARPLWELAALPAGGGGFEDTNRWGGLKAGPIRPAWSIGERGGKDHNGGFGCHSLGQGRTDFWKGFTNEEKNIVGYQR